MKILSKIKNNFSKKSSKFLVGAMALCLPLLNCTSAFAAGEASSDVSSITGQMTTSLTSAKTDFVVALGAIVGVALSFFIVKFIVKQGIGFFAKIASKN